MVDGSITDRRCDLLQHPRLRDADAGGAGITAYRAEGKRALDERKEEEEVVKPEWKIVMRLRRDWLAPRFPKGTRVVVDKIRVDEEFATKLEFHVVEPHLPGSGDGWIDSGWFDSFRTDRHSK